MKHTKVLYFFCILFLSCSNNEIRKDEGKKLIYERLHSLLRQKEYFKLESQLIFYIDSIDKEQELFFQSFIDNAFNRNEDAIKDIDILLADAKTPDSIKADLAALESDSYFKTFQYAKDAQIDTLLLNHYQRTLDSAKISDIKNHLLLCSALKNIASQKTEISASTFVRWTKDKIGLMEIPIKCEGKFYNAIFDTRANISSITRTYAGRLGLKIMNASYTEGSGITGIRFKTGLGIADSLYIGNILVRNAVFQIMPDSILYIAPVKFSLDIIIGFPIIEQLNEIHIFSNGNLAIPLHPSKSVLHNLALDHLDPVVSLKTDDDTLCFHFDSGATSTELYSSYFNKYKSKIIQSGQKEIKEFGGAGGAQKKETYIMGAFHVYLGNKKATLYGVDVLTQKIYDGEKFYGNLGQDFINKFHEVILNFRSMYIDAK
jgi:hypothetical protein